VEQDLSEASDMICKGKATTAAAALVVDKFSSRFD